MGDMIEGRDHIGVGVGAMILNEEGLIYLAKRGPAARNERGAWEFPGGGFALASDWPNRDENALRVSGLSTATLNTIGIHENAT